MTGFCVPVKTIKCMKCGHTLLYTGRGRHICTNPDCPVDHMMVNRHGRVYKTVMVSTPMEAEK